MDLFTHILLTIEKIYCTNTYTQPTTTVISCCDKYSRYQWVYLCYISVQWRVNVLSHFYMIYVLVFNYYYFFKKLLSFAYDFMNDDVWWYRFMQLRSFLILIYFLKVNYLYCINIIIFIIFCSNKSFLIFQLFIL